MKAVIRHCRFACLFLGAAVWLACAGEALESRGHILTADGSLLQCLIGHALPWSIKTSSGIQALKIENISSIDLAERVDPNIENDALVAVGDLQSDKFETREKAEAKLRSLGRPAAKALKQALTVQDTEVVKRARALLVEMGAVEDEGLSQDRVTLRDGTMLRGELELTELSVRSHIGRLRVPVEALERIVFEATSNDAKRDDAFASADSKEIAVPLPVAGHIENAGAEAWDPSADAKLDPGALGGWLAEAQRNTLTMDKIADPKTPKVSIDTKPGDRLEDAYADRGVMLRATEAGTGVEVSGERLQSFSSGRSLLANKSDLEIRFALPHTKGSVPAGVLHVGAVVRTEGPGSIGIAGYDAAGRLLAQTLNTNAPTAAGQAVLRDEFIGLRSKTPIARVRIFRVGALKEKGDVLLDDIVFDRIATAGLRADQCRVSLIGGDRWIGKAVDAGKDTVALKAEFLGEHTEPLTFKFALVSCYEPARGSMATAAETPSDKKDDEKKPRRYALAHGVLLQSGEMFCAHLFALDDKIAVFGLSRGALLKLPRETLRKIELLPPTTPPGEAPAPTVVEKDEKPGVHSNTKKRFDNPAAPLPPPEKKDPANNPAQGVAFQEAEIVRVDPETHELTIKDELGEMTMNITNIRALVFPPNPNAGIAAKKRAWVLTLREGSHFDADILNITPTDITAEMAGGTVLLPAETIETVERK